MTQRIIKFRAWDRKEQKMSEPRTFPDLSGMWMLTDALARKSNEPATFSFMQFTGLHDKNGKEIYEGDVVRVDGRKEYENCKPKPKKDEYLGYFSVEMEIGHWGIETNWNHIKGYECSTHIMGDTEGNAENIEVIGNIYENPNLLTQ